ncbi:hypothetical protein Airi01_031300 [Actinoallomurus iriomotensis]|uniref:Uncharacterized protein n=1 Tax=Actinoallomurus iriomotensis TaxID=478107 RepID=A0A9W6RFK1_9ACTN|nr:hypothetical protein Airi01_031300 [Actinoallomurus iriomotensis]
MVRDRAHPAGASRHLVDAALEAGAGRSVQESICFIYAGRGHAWIDKDVPLDPPPFGRANEAAEVQARRFTEAGGTGVELRFGRFYAWDSTCTRYMRRMARRRLPAIPGPKDATRRPSPPSARPPGPGTSRTTGRRPAGSSTGRRPRRSAYGRP